MDEYSYLWFEQLFVCYFCQITIQRAANTSTESDTRQIVIQISYYPFLVNPSPAIFPERSPLTNEVGWC